MNSLIKIKAMLCVVLGLMSLAVRAEMGSGSFSNDFTGLVNLWDISGTYSQSGAIGSETYTIVMDANGALTGDGTFDYNDGVGILSANFTIGGQVKSAGSSLKVTLLLTITSGTGTVQGIPVTFKAALKDTFTLDPNSHELIGKSGGKLSVTIPSLGRTISHGVPSSPAAVDLGPGVDGIWGLSLTLAPNGTVYSGTATINLSNGKSFDLNATGAYSSKTDLSKLTLTGSDPNFPMNLNLVASFNGTNISIQGLKGKAVGQKLKFVVN